MKKALLYIRNDDRKESLQEMLDYEVEKEGGDESVQKRD